MRNVPAMVMAMATAQKINDADYQDRLTHFRNVRQEIIEDAGHMMHHDQPEVLARLIEDFLP